MSSSLANPVTQKSIDDFLDGTLTTGLIIHNDEDVNRFCFTVAVEFACGAILEYQDGSDCDYNDLGYTIRQFLPQHPKMEGWVDPNIVIPELQPLIKPTAVRVMKEVTQRKSLLQNVNIVDCFQADNNGDVAVIAVRYRK